MTMHDAFHPDDERLAAYAGGDADALSDRELIAHLTTCNRCQPMVDELSMLRGALAALPDIAPSRPLRLIPPVPAPAAPRGRPLEWLRRLAAPAMAAGAGLVLIGAFGVSGVVTQLGGTAAGAPTKEVSASNGVLAPLTGSGASTARPVPATDSADYAKSNQPRNQTPAAAATQRPATGGTEGTPRTPATPSREQPWLTLLIAGFALFGISAVLRYTLNPRAG